MYGIPNIPCFEVASRRQLRRAKIKISNDRIWKNEMVALVGEYKYQVWFDE